MSAPNSNRFWEMRSSHGRNPIFKDPDELWNAACEYFKWVEDNPLYEEKAFHFQGQVIKEPIQKMRAMTIQGLCLFLDVGHQTINDYGKRDDFSGVVTRIKEVIYQQKFSGAAADLLNSNIIARDLGLSDKKDIDHQSSDGSMTPQIITRRIVDGTDDTDA